MSKYVPWALLAELLLSMPAAAIVLDMMHELLLHRLRQRGYLLFLVKCAAAHHQRKVFLHSKQDQVTTQSGASKERGVARIIVRTA